jgi:hypothetical protein
MLWSVGWQLITTEIGNKNVRFFKFFTISGTHKIDGNDSLKYYFYDDGSIMHIRIL